MRLVTTGTIPQRAQVWNSAVRVPNAYLDTSAESSTTTFSTPPGLEVHTPPCLVQNEQVQARAGISAGSGSQAREKEMFPQWHLPWINTGLSEPLDSHDCRVTPVDSYRVDCDRLPANASETVTVAPY